MPGSPQSGCLDLSFRSQLDLPKPRFHLGLGIEEKAELFQIGDAPLGKRFHYLRCQLKILTEPVQAIRTEDQLGELPACAGRAGSPWLR